MELDLTGLLAEVLERDENGNYAMSGEEVFRRFFNTKPTCGRDIRLLAEAGGNSVLHHLEQGAAYVLREQGLIRADGMVDLIGLRKWMGDYVSALSELPNLRQKLETASAAQENYERLVTQKRLADEIRAGALRGPKGVITKSSFSSWLARNEQYPVHSQPEGVLDRLRQISNSLEERPGGLLGFRRQFKEAYSKAIEDAIFDPAYARELVERSRRQGL